MAWLAVMTRHHSRSSLSPRSSDLKSLGTTALITGAVVGSVVILISFCAFFVRLSRIKEQKKEEEETRQIEEETRRREEEYRQREALLAEERPFWEADYEEERDVPPERLAAYKHEFWNLPREEREAITLGRKWYDAATILADDSVSFKLEYGHDRATREEERRFVMGKWWEDHGQHAVWDHQYPGGGPSDLQRNNIGPRSNPTSPVRRNYHTEDVELGELSTPNSPCVFSSPSTRAPVRSNSRSIAPRPELNISTGRDPDLQVYSKSREPQGYDPHNAHGVDNAIRSAHLEVPGNTFSRVAPSVAPSNMTRGTWNMPEGYTYDTDRNSTHTDAETTISNDHFRGDVERNRHERRVFEEQKERERQAREHEQELEEHDMRGKLQRAKREYGR